MEDEDRYQKEYENGVKIAKVISKEFEVKHVSYLASFVAISLLAAQGLSAADADEEGENNFMKAVRAARKDLFIHHSQVRESNG